VTSDTGYRIQEKATSNIMKHGPKPRVGSSAGLKARKAEENILLARGLSARYCGANTPLTSLSSDDIEKDLRHMEAYANACTTYAQQFYRFQKESKGEKEKTVQPLIAMPVRIDPEEEKRLINLRQKIQQCESQREVLESEYLSLRAHYVYLSQKLKTCRSEVNERVAFLQAQVQKRGKLVALQRARLQIAREVSAALNYRLSSEVDVDVDPEDSTADLIDVWVQLEEQSKKAEQECRSDGIQKWEALRVPSLPPGIPLLLSPLAKAPGFTAAWAAGGMFGSKHDSLVWLESNLPQHVPSRSKELPSLREESELLKRELDRERQLNKELQTSIIGRRKQNDELIAMMTLLRTETEAVIARHNILLDSDLARDAADKLHEEEELKKESSEPKGAEPVVASDVAKSGEHAPPVVPVKENADEEGEITEDGEIKPPSQPSSHIRTKVEDNANDGDDEGDVGDDDDDEEGEIVEEGANSKRNFEEQDENGSPRTKRRKL
jgi:hypothetical protein